MSSVLCLVVSGYFSSGGLLTCRRRRGVTTREPYSFLIEVLDGRGGSLVTGHLLSLFRVNSQQVVLGQECT